MANPLKCDLCTKPATVHLTQIVNNKVHKVDLCEACAQAKGVTDPSGFSLADLLLKASLNPESGGAAGVRCDETKGAITEGPGVQMSELISLAEAGRYRIYVEKVFPFEKTADAQEANRAGHATGKIVVAVAPQSSRR